MSRKKNKKSKGQKRSQKVKKREQKKKEVKEFSSTDTRIRSPLLPRMPHIIGADFNYEVNDINEIQRQIDSIKDKQPKDHKIRILFSSEASYLHTGFSTYMREVLKRLQKTGKYEIAEFGSYGASPDQDPRAKQIPWKYYHNLPENNVEVVEYGQPGTEQYRENQFGKWKLSFVLADFRPDIVLLNRDNWMDSYVLKNDLRDNFLVYWMACVDGYPQKWEWIHDYTQVDGLFAYSWFGKRVLEEQSRCELAKRYKLKELNVQNVCQPGVNIDIFKPMPKDEVYKVFGIKDPSIKFVGTVMRNQPRKLFTRIIESFRGFCEQDPKASHNVMLLLHTSIPDVGWNIPEVVRQNGLEDRVVYTYICNHCGQIVVSHFRGSPADCFLCKGQKCLNTPNTQLGLDEKQFAYIYNLMDVYLQLSIAEGDGMPMNEAKACGIPCLSSNYSALHEKGKNGGAISIANATIYTEHETHQWRSLFNRDDLIEKLKYLFNNEGKKLLLGNEGRECAVKYYNWDLTAKKWELAIDKAEIKDRSKNWDAPVDIKILPEEAAPNQLSNEDFIIWCYKNIVSGKDPDEQGMKTWKDSLNNAGPVGSEGNKKARDQLEKFFREKVEKENKAKELKQNPKKAVVNPIDRVKNELDPLDTFRILYVIPETNGDVFISTGVINGIAKKWPDAQIYVATQKEYFDILKGNPNVKKVVEYHESMFNYRIFETWGPQKNPFEIVFAPSIVTQKIPHWIHNGHGDWLGKVYADMCTGVEFGNTWIAEEPIEERPGESIDLPEKFITVHSQTLQDPKDYDYMQEVIDKIENIDKIQIGGPKDKPLKGTTDFRGKTSPQQLAWLMHRATMHLGLDSFPMHIAAHVGIPAIIMFGGTYWQQGVRPEHRERIRCIETKNRGPCVTSCHLIECEAKKAGYNKCINNIPVNEILEEVGNILGSQHVKEPEPIKISSYMIVRDGIKYGYPFKECIEAAAKVSDEVIVVDGGSTDGTWYKLHELVHGPEKSGMPEQYEDGKPCEIIPNLKIYQHEWDFDNPTLFGDEKTYARQLCTGTHLIQLDCDEIIHENEPGAIRKLVEHNRFMEIMDLPCINFYENDHTIRVEQNFWKWRISRSDANLIHGVHTNARIFDKDTGRITMDKKTSDGCEYIYADSLEIAKHFPVFDAKLFEIHEKRKHGVINDSERIFRSN
jgi:ADP-heptose:LPS heptosyltransferase/glycosyltransferase involved in cell wall biosynthesis